MHAEHHIPQDLTQEIMQIVTRHLDLDRYQVFFFGSRVTGNASVRSDIDVGISGPAPVERKVLRAIREEVEELPTLYSIDVVDFASVSEEFREVALQHVLPLANAAS